MSITTNYRTGVNGVSYKRIAEILRAARDLMNNNGRHWVKGEEKIDISAVDPDSHYADTYSMEKTGEYAYCSIGAVREVVGKNELEYEAALFELIKVMDPNSLVYAEESYEEDWFNNYYDEHGYENAPPGIEPPTPNADELYSYIDLNDTIATVNDDDQTQWEDIKGWFTSAAKRAMAKK